MGVHKNHNGGVVVNIASFLGLVTRPAAPVYNATKHGVVSFVRSMKVRVNRIPLLNYFANWNLFDLLTLDQEHNKAVGVRIVCICPGMTQTNLIGVDTWRKTMLDLVKTQDIEDAFSVHLQKWECNIFILRNTFLTLNLFINRNINFYPQARKRGFCNCRNHKERTWGWCLGSAKRWTTICCGKYNWRRKNAHSVLGTSAY